MSLQLKRVGQGTASVLEIDGGSKALFSYKTLVALRTPTTAIRNQKKYSSTTSKHINAFLRGAGEAIMVDEAALEQKFKETVASTLRG